MSRPRSDIEMAVILSDTEREQYRAIRAKAHEVIVSTRKSKSTHDLLHYIHQMRQICSHGLVEESLASTNLPPRPRGTVCNKCLEVISSDTTPREDSIRSDESSYCLECRAEEDSFPDTTSDSVGLRASPRNNMDPAHQSGISKIDFNYDGDVDMDSDETLTSIPRFSSKVQTVVSKIADLDQQQRSDCKPIKRCHL